MESVIFSRVAPLFDEGKQIIEELADKINELTEENEKLKIRVETLEDVVTKLKEMKDTDNSKLFLSKLVLAIQEINKRDNLQNTKGLEYLEDLRIDRHQMSHYMFITSRN